jgi:hypothetical protein
MNWAALILLFFCHISVAQAQACEFDYYPKKGGHYLFSTYFEKDNKTPEQGIVNIT